MLLFAVNSAIISVPLNDPLLCVFKIVLLFVCYLLQCCFIYCSTVNLLHLCTFVVVKCVLLDSTLHRLAFCVVSILFLVN